MTKVLRSFILSFFSPHNRFMSYSTPNGTTGLFLWYAEQPPGELDHICTCVYFSNILVPIETH